MNNLTKTLSTAVLSLGLLFATSTVFSSTLPVGNTTLYSNDANPSGNPKGTISAINNGATYIQANGGALILESYLLYQTTGGVNQLAIETSLEDYYTAYPGVTAFPPNGFEVDGFMSSDDPGWFGTLVDGGVSGTYDIGSGYAFNGFLVKASDVTLFVLFDQYVQSLTWNTNFTGDYFGLPNNAMSHVGVINPVPVPAAAFLFAPALLGFMGLRRKAKKS